MDFELNFEYAIQQIINKCDYIQDVCFDILAHDNRETPPSLVNDIIHDLDEIREKLTEYSSLTQEDD
jgi:hypothetical protein